MRRNGSANLEMSGPACPSPWFPDMPGPCPNSWLCPCPSPWPRSKKSCVLVRVRSCPKSWPFISWPQNCTSRISDFRTKFFTKFSFLWILYDIKYASLKIETDFGHNLCQLSLDQSHSKFAFEHCFAYSSRWTCNPFALLTLIQLAHSLHSATMALRVSVWDARLRPRQETLRPLENIYFIFLI